MKRVVSVSLGTSARDKTSVIEFLGEGIELVREGVDGDKVRFARRFSELDGKVDALGVGGADLHVFSAGRKYTFSHVERLVQGARRTPVVDGSGLKNTLESQVIRQLQSEGTIDFRNSRTLLVSGVDRFGMAAALHELGAPVTYGDLMFALGLPFPVRRFSQLNALAKLLLPVIVKLPPEWIYPTGLKQLVRTPKFSTAFQQADIIAGDWHFIRRFAPDDLSGKTILTQTLRTDDFKLLKEIGVEKVVTTTPSIGGEAFATNVVEGAFAAYLGPEIMRSGDAAVLEAYRDLLARLAWRPNVVDLGR